MLQHTTAFFCCCFFSLGCLCEDGSFTEGTTLLSDSLSATTKFQQAPKSETTEHESDEIPGLVPGLIFNLLLPPNPGSVLPSVQTSLVNTRFHFFPCCFPPNDSLYPEVFKDLQTHTNLAAI